MRRVHVETTLLNGVGDVRPGEGKYWRGPARLRNVDASRRGAPSLLDSFSLVSARMDAALQFVMPARSIEKLIGVLGLVEEEPILCAMNVDTEKVFDRTHIFHSKGSLQANNDLMKKSRSGRERIMSSTYKRR